MVYCNTLVKNLIKKYKTRDPFVIAQSLNITVKFKSFSSTHPEGLFKRMLNKKFIIINTKGISNDIHLKSVMAHELGHALLHSSSDMLFLHDHTHYERGKFEKEANSFAAELLINEEDLRNSDFDNLSLEQISSALKVPSNLLELYINNHK